MVGVVTLAEAKAHLRVEGVTDDTIIQLYIDAATARIINYLNQPIPGSTDSPVSPTPAPIKASSLLIIGDLYENREEQIAASGIGVLVKNPAAINMLYPYRVNIGI